jgi:organic hydroperoxide reductase OsmC/OhrA
MITATSEEKVGRNGHVTVAAPAVSPGRAKNLAAEAHRRRPYSNATRGNVPVTLEVVDATPM